MSSTADHSGRAEAVTSTTPGESLARSPGRPPGRPPRIPLPGRAAPGRRTPLRRWAREVGWRHVVGLLALAFAAFPVLYVVSASLNPRGTLASTGLVPTEVSLANYTELLSGRHGPFHRWYLNSMLVCTAVAGTQVLFSLLGAYAFSRFRFTGRRGGLLTVLLIMMFPATLSMIAVYTMISDLGQVLPAVGLNTLIGYSLALMGGSLGQVWLIKGSFDTVPRELDEAAVLDGCTHWQVFWLVLLPTLRPIVATTFLLAFISVISEFLLGGIFLTDGSVKTLAVGLYGLLDANRSSNLGVFAAGAVLTMLPVIALFQILQRYIVADSTLGAVKG
ncbi:sugar ABC transporter permease [Actinomyces wuliandei]|uniref:sugar ABC transporter permease n=1 Tax=Actinomyces wuliandei TaxID=2057743 RepID=UPI00111A86B4|nr:sugar ABC transporter permease [Actinomyces wuliandei]